MFADRTLDERNQRCMNLDAFYNREKCLSVSLYQSVRPSVILDISVRFPLVESQ